MKTWIAVINRAEARFFETNSHKNGELKFLSKIENPKGRMKAIDINADRPGVYTSSATTHRGLLVKPQSPVERVSQMFALQIARFLEHHRNQNSFDELTVIVEPHYLGKIRAAFSKELAAVVTREIPKDLRKVSNEQLKERLWPAGGTAEAEI